MTTFEQPQDAAAPVLLLDIDGVLLVMPEKNPGKCPGGGFVPAPPEYDGYTFYNPTHSAWLNKLVLRMDAYYLSSHRGNSHKDIGQYLELPELDWIDYWQYESSGQGKRIVAASERFPGRPVAWIDDDHDGAAFAWAEHRNADEAPTLVIKPDSEQGLNCHHIQEVERWLGGLSLLQ